MIYQTHVSNKRRWWPPAWIPRFPLSRRAGAQKRVDISAAQRPVVVEIGDDGFHKGLRKRDRALPVAEVVEQDGERQLLRAFALISPFEAELREALHLVMLAERLAVDRDN